MRIEDNNLAGMNNFFAMGTNTNNRYNPKEVAVARKLGMSVQEFSALSEAEKMQKVQAYNKSHPNDPIENKGAQPQQNNQGSQMTQFQNDVNWNNVKLQ